MTGTGTSGPYSATRASGSTPYSSTACAASCSRRSRCSFRAISVPCAVFTTLSSSPARPRTAGAHRLERPRCRSRSPPRPRHAARRPGQRRLGGLDRDTRARRRPPGRPPPGGRALTAPAAPLPGGPLGRRRPRPASRPARRSRAAAPPRCAPRAAPPSRRSRGRGPLGQFLALVVGQLVLELRVGVPAVPRPPPRRARSSAAASLAWSFSARLRAPRHRGVEPLGLVRRGPRGAAEPAEPAGDLRRGRVHRLHPAADLLERLPGGFLRLGRHGQLAAASSRARPRPASPPPRRPRRARRAATAAAPTRRAPSARRAGRRPRSRHENQDYPERRRPLSRSAVTTTSPSSSGRAPPARQAPSPGRGRPTGARR